MRSTDSRTVVGVFEDSATAQRVVDELTREGFRRDRISIHASDTYAGDAARGNTMLSGVPHDDSSGGGISGFFRRLFGGGDDIRHYDEAVRRGSAIVTVDTDGAGDERASEIMDQFGAIDIDQHAATWEGYEGAQSSGQRTIPVVEEDLQVDKHEVRRGGVRVFNRVTEQPVQEQVQLRDEHVRVDRRPVNRAATEADLRATDEVIEIEEYDEEAVVGKTARVVEEVVVGKEVDERTETIRDTVRRTDVQVEQTGAGNDPGYQYGHRMASDQRYRGRSWSDVEPTLRSDYERTNPNSTWDQVKNSVRRGWDSVSGRR